MTQFAKLFDVMFDEANTSIDLAESIYIFCLTWSIGGHLDEKGRHEFDEFLKKLANKMLPKQSLYDSNFDLQVGRWNPWEDQIDEFKPTPGMTYNKMFVPTV